MEPNHELKHLLIDGELCLCEFIYSNIPTVKVTKKNRPVKSFVIEVKKSNFPYYQEYIKKTIKWFNQRYGTNIDKSNYLIDLKNNKVMILGKVYEIKWIEGSKRNKYEYLNDCFYIHITGEEAKLEMVKKILTDYSTIHLTQCLRKWETIINVGPTEEIIFKFLKRKLGTCYWRKNIIELDIKLVCFPEDVFKVVVIHELCHYIEPNHGPNFHRLQDKYCPDNKELHKQIFSAIYDTEDESEE